MKQRTAFVSTAILCLILISCGTSEVKNALGLDSPVERAGYCPPTATIDQAPFLETVFDREWQLIDAEALDEIRTAGSFQGFRFAESTVERLNDVPTATFGWVGGNAETGGATLIIAEPSVPHPFFVRYCGLQSSEYLKNIVSDIGGTTYESSLAVMGDMGEDTPILEEFRRLRDEEREREAERNRPWDERPPRERTIYSGEAPADIREQLVSYSVWLTMPTEEAESSDLLVALYVVDVGIGDAYPLNLALPDAQRPGYSRTDIGVSVMPGGEAELGIGRTVSREPMEQVGVLTTLTHEQLEELSADGEIELELTTDGDSVRLVEIRTGR